MITKRGPYFWLDIQINKRRIRRSLKTRERTLAISLANKLTQDYREGALLGKTSIKDFTTKYMDWAWSSKPASADRESQRLKKILSFFAELGIQHLNDITPLHLEQLRARLKEQGLEKTTINRYLQLIRGMFYKAIDWEIYKGPNPARKIKFYREESRIQALSAEEVERILEAAKKIAKQAKSPLQRAFPDLVQLALNTGLRKSEILNLRWKDAREDEAIVHGKGDRTRMVPLNKAAATIIGRQPKKTEYVFDIPNRNQPDLFRRTILQIQKQTGIPFHFHLLRHFFATSLLGKGVDIVTIAAILGHSKMMTSLLYSHTDKEKKRFAVDYLDKMNWSK